MRFLDALFGRPKPVPPCTPTHRRTPRYSDDWNEGEFQAGNQKWAGRQLDANKFESDRIDVAEGNRVPHITDHDRKVLSQVTLCSKKASLLKEYYATGLSTKETAKVFQGKRGFSVRTLDDYWAAFNEAERRQTEQNE
jgi:hypothetical protein